MNYQEKSKVQQVNLQALQEERFTELVEHLLEAVTGAGNCSSCFIPPSDLDDQLHELHTRVRQTLAKAVDRGHVREHQLVDHHLGHLLADPSIQVALQRQKEQNMVADFKELPFHPL